MLNSTPREEFGRARIAAILQRNHFSLVTRNKKEKFGDVAGVLLFEQDNS
jgi:hypothetical protein